jgi:membrane peptidoglycan carboxypeptidase
MVGGSPKYTTVLWAGRTDNAPMVSTISAANLASPIWQSLQVSLHKGIAPESFSTAGLIKVQMSGGRIVQSGGTTEFLTQNQINILKEFGSKVGTPEYNPKKENFYTGKNIQLVDRNFQELPIETEQSQSSDSSSSSSQPAIAENSSESNSSSSQKSSAVSSIKSSVANNSVGNSLAANSVKYSAISSLLP